jgi:hypothetical protein
VEFEERRSGARQAEENRTKTSNFEFEKFDRWSENFFLSRTRNYRKERRNTSENVQDSKMVPPSQREVRDFSPIRSCYGANGLENRRFFDYLQEFPTPKKVPFGMPNPFRMKSWDMSLKASGSIRNSLSGQSRDPSEPLWADGPQVRGGVVCATEGGQAVVAGSVASGAGLTGNGAKSGNRKGPI